MSNQIRSETRRERYDQKTSGARNLPLSIVTVNFDHCDNLAFTVRTAACYGVRDIFVIGSIPDRKLINPKSGSLFDYVNLRSFAQPIHFLKYAAENNFKLVSAEITDTAVSLFNYHFDLNTHNCLVLGHETTGVPVEIISNSECVYIPMPGVGFCLNTSQAGTAIMTEYVRQYIAGAVHERN